MQDLFQTYVDDLNKLRSAFHEELAAEARELSNAMSKYSQRSEAALASFMDKVSARGVEFEVLAETRLNQFRGLPAKDSLPDVSDGPLAHTPTDADLERVAAAAELALTDGLLAESDADRKPKVGRLMALVKSDPARTQAAAQV
jgi:hypothetical protein